MHRVLVTIVLATLGACTADSGDEGILITRAVAPGDKCTFTGIESEPAYSSGALQMAPIGDGSLGGSYKIFPQLKSKITADSGAEAQRTIIVREANVDLTFADATLFTKDQLTAMHDAGITHFKQLFTVALLPNGGVADGGFELVPRAVGDAIQMQKPDITIGGGDAFQTTVIGTFTVKGDMSGETIASNPFQFPVTLVNKGLINDRGACPITGAIATGNTCNPGQDSVVDCCTKDTTTYCPALTQ